MTPADDRPIDGDAAAPPLRVVHADADLVVIDKPASLLVHRSSLDEHETRSAAELLRAQRGEPLWLLHRLDKATSGLLAFARNVDTARALGPAFESAFEEVWRGYKMEMLFCLVVWIFTTREYQPEAHLVTNVFRYGLAALDLDTLGAIEQ